MPEVFGLDSVIGVGVGDFQAAITSEIARINKETKGDALAQMKLLHRMLRDRNLLTEAEVRVMDKLATTGHRAAGKENATDAYFQSRDLYNSLIIQGDASPVALVLAASAVGSYEPTKSSDGSGTVVYKKSAGDWEGRGKTLGAAVGAYFGGVAGAAIGAEIGGAVGHAVDKCLD